MLSITYYPDPLLRRISAEITGVDDELRQLARDMLETMYESNGIGLAAPQVGVSRRFVVIHIPDSTDGPLYLVNPEIIAKSKEKESAEEGCLSLPGLSAKIKRPAAVTLRARDLDWNEIQIEADGLLARCFQHEIDHLDGLLFIDKASLAAKFSLRGELNELEEKFKRAQTLVGENV